MNRKHDPVCVASGTSPAEERKGKKKKGQQQRFSVF